ncbi:uncharacterized protein DNG_00716 [Cephalotrichum gorgonifer]|uniref:Uncharacterized protein n=1 Tax=Cephalotrichum gorgonifer TaxID=2041049 RepID=A0AAE8MP85_9PEZI|nr:uncharacterized protein DNG_00716 [Cephalotrichum gorgonifer]
MPLRNPFGRRSGISLAQDENARADTNGSSPVVGPPGFERVETVGSMASFASTRSSKNTDNDTSTYKLSVVNDSGIYLPPSPTEKSAEKSPWPHRLLSPSRTSCEAPTSTGEIEPFSISRESFDSYRRSFDISARSPVSHDVPDRQSLDSARFPRTPRAPRRDRLAEREIATEEEDQWFEDVGLDDGGPPQQAHPGGKRRAIFSMFYEGQDPGSSSPAVSRFLPGRKRNQSGQGAELRKMEGPGTPKSSEGVV